MPKYVRKIFKPSVFKNGKGLSSNTEEALMYVAKVGAMSKKLWDQEFSKGSRCWKNKQLRILIKNDLLKPHNCQLDKIYVLGEKGKAFARENNWSLVDPVLANQIVHDETIGHGLLRLERSAIGKNWMIEREIKSSSRDTLIIEKDSERRKYPDAIFQAFMGGEFCHSALEYERTGKTSARYRSILWSYSKLQALSLVLFIVEEESIKKRIEKAIRHLGVYSILERIGYMNVRDWRENPIEAPIEIYNAKTSFKKLSLIK